MNRTGVSLKPSVRKSEAQAMQTQHTDGYGRAGEVCEHREVMTHLVVSWDVGN